MQIFACLGWCQLALSAFVHATKKVIWECYAFRSNDPWRTCENEDYWQKPKLLLNCIRCKGHHIFKVTEKPREWLRVWFSGTVFHFWLANPLALACHWSREQTDSDWGWLGLCWWWRNGFHSGLIDYR